MTIANIKEVYGGPYHEETDLIIRENELAKVENREPDFDSLFVERGFISSGAKHFILELVHPSDPPVGPFITNVEVDYKAEEENGVNRFPEVVETEKVSGEEEVSGEEATAEGSAVDDESLEELLGEDK